MPITNEKLTPRVSITFSEPDEIHIVDINTARRIRKDIDKQIQQHTEKNIADNLMDAVSSIFRGDSDE